MPSVKAERSEGCPRAALYFGRPACGMVNIRPQQGLTRLAAGMVCYALEISPGMPDGSSNAGPHTGATG